LIAYDTPILVDNTWKYPTDLGWQLVEPEELCVLYTSLGVLLVSPECEMQNPTNGSWVSISDLQMHDTVVAPLPAAVEPDYTSMDYLDGVSTARFCIDGTENPMHRWISASMHAGQSRDWAAGFVFGAINMNQRPVFSGNSFSAVPQRVVLEMFRLGVLGSLLESVDEPYTTEVSLKFTRPQIAQTPIPVSILDYAGLDPQFAMYAPPVGEIVYPHGFAMAADA
jgi:hypothetical protein